MDVESIIRLVVFIVIIAISMISSAKKKQRKKEATSSLPSQGQANSAQAKKPKSVLEELFGRLNPEPEGFGGNYRPEKTVANARVDEDDLFVDNSEIYDDEVETSLSKTTPKIQESVSEEGLLKNKKTFTKNEITNQVAYNIEEEISSSSIKEEDSFDWNASLIKEQPSTHVRLEKLFKTHSVEELAIVLPAIMNEYSSQKLKSF